MVPTSSYRRDDSLGIFGLRQKPFTAKLTKMSDIGNNIRVVWKSNSLQIIAKSKTISPTRPGSDRHTQFRYQNVRNDIWSIMPLEIIFYHV